MNNRIATFALCAAALLVTGLNTGRAAAVEPRIGAVVQRDYRGAVAAPHGASAAHAIQYRDAVFALDTVKTGASGTTALEFLDETTVQVGAGAELRLDNFVYDPATTVGGGQLSFAVGAFRYVGGKMTTEQNIQLQTPTATMVIRGTELVIYVWPDGRTEVNVVSGAVEVMSCAGNASQLAMTGMQITVMPDCMTHVAAAPTLPDDLTALTLPTRETGDKGDSDDDDGGRGGEHSRPEPESKPKDHNRNNKTQT
ncbi:FecR domain-containing protein [Dongia mobilis]|uniref:FecR family protein n=1 Tax=Dongia sp. TaxID=1977262 RepID=UPI0026EF45A0